MNKQLIIPLVACIGLIVKYATGYELPQEEMDIIADAVLSIGTLYGMFVAPKKEGKSNDIS